MLIVVGSLKGGSGKSTIAFNLAVWLACHRKNVAVIDADPQATLSDVLAVRGEQGFEPVISQLPIAAIADSDQLNQYAMVLVDVGTASMDHLKMALSKADRVLIPVPPSQADIWSTQRFLRFVQVHSGEHSPQMQTFVNRADTHQSVRESHEAAEALRLLQDAEFIEQKLAQRTLYRRAFSEGMAVFEQEPRSKAAQEWLGLAQVLFPDVGGRFDD